jgi:hypothetical protein
MSLAALGLLYVLASGPGIADPHETLEAPAARCRRLCQERACELYEFLGFAHDSLSFCYSRTACPGAQGEGKPRYDFHVREVKPGKRKLATPRIETDDDDKFPAYLKTHDYRVIELTGKRTGDNAWEFVAPAGQKIVVEMKTEQAVAWYLTVSHCEKEIFRHRGEFKEIYFSLIPRLYVSPDGQKIGLFMTLDSMVKLDAGFAVFSLNP